MISPKSDSIKPYIRLNKFVAHAGICSRREADDLIRNGLIRVNGKVVTEVGTKVSVNDSVKYKGKVLKAEKKIYIVLNKPKDFITTVKDEHAPKNVMQLVKNVGKERIYPVGRLDRNTTGILLFTNDGELTKKLTHPKHRKKKIYHVFLNRKVDRKDLKKIETGFELYDGFIRADAISYVNNNFLEVGIELHSGKNRIVRRIFEHLGYKVIKIDRVYFAGITKKNLSRGKWRFLTDVEIRMLKYF